MQRSDVLHEYYTIPRNNRELQPCQLCNRCERTIIPYQEIIGNYSEHVRVQHEQYIIPYQEIIGNYSVIVDIGYHRMLLYHTKK